MASTLGLAHNPNRDSQIQSRVAWVYVAENVGHGFGTSASPASLFDQFMRSDSHRANILSSRASYVAVGCVRTGNELWVTQNFWQPR